MPKNETGTDTSNGILRGWSAQKLATWFNTKFPSSHHVDDPDNIDEWIVALTTGKILHPDELDAQFREYQEQKEAEKEENDLAELKRKQIVEERKEQRAEEKEKRAERKGIDSYSLIEPLSQAVKAVLPHPVWAKSDDNADCGAKVTGIKATQANCAAIMGAYSIESKYNVISREPEYSIEGRKLTGHDPFTEIFAHLYSIYSVNNFTTKQLESFVKQQTNRSRYNPAAEWIKSATWDGVERIDDLINTLNLADGYPKELAALLIRKWLVALCKRGVWEEAFQSKGVLILQGPGDIGKTSWFSRLVPAGLFHSVITLDPENKDSIMAATAVWLAEIGEIESTTSKKDINALKGFFSSKEWRIRPPYGRGIETHINRTGFCGTANSRNVIPDDNTGGNRYWVINIDSYDWDAYNKIEKQQLFAEILATVDLNDSRNYELNNEELEMLVGKNKDSMRGSPDEDIILRYFDFSNYKLPEKVNGRVLVPEGYQQLSAGEVYKVIYDSEPKGKESQAIGAALRQITGSDGRKSNGRYVWDMPPRTKEGF